MSPQVRAAVHDQLRRVMVGHVGVDTADHAGVIGNTAEMGDIVGVLGPRFSVTAERPGRGEDDGTAFDQGILEPVQKRIGYRLAVQATHLGLGIKEVQLAGSPRHEDENDVASPGGEMRLPGCQRVRAISGGRRRSGPLTIA